MLLGMVDRAAQKYNVCCECEKLGDFNYTRELKTEDVDGWTCPLFHDGGNNRDLRFAYTNLVGCIPPTDEYGKEGEPDEEAIRSCRPRLQEIIDIVRPRLLIRVGAFARKWITPGFKASVKVPDGCNVIDIDHPGSIIKASQAQQSLLIKRVVVTLSQAFGDL